MIRFVNNHNFVLFLQESFKMPNFVLPNNAATDNF